MRALFAIGFIAIVLALATFHACKKEKIIIQGSRTDTIYVQYEHCQYDTSLPINCYTTHLRGSARRLRAGGGVDTLELTTLQYVTLGYCEFDKFVPLYILRAEAIFPGRIPDTAMCRTAGIPLCCPMADLKQPCLQAEPQDASQIIYEFNDVATTTFSLTNICNKQDIRKFSFNLIGPTQYIESPDSNPALLCQDFIRPLLDSACQVFTFRNCTIKLIDISRKHDYDTVKVVYLMQGDNMTWIPCCAGAYKEVDPTRPFERTAKIILQCD